MSETVSHHDKTRAGVGKTAFAVAGARALESQKPDHLIYDEFSLKIWESIKDMHNEFFLAVPGEKLAELVDGMAVRTKFIDDEMVGGLSEVDQIVVIGAGLDFRPWRMHQYFSTDAEKESLRSKKWFEIDFQEMFDYKLKQIGDSTTYFEYHSIVANVCVDNWEQALLSQGFDPSRKSMWLLEGFTGYLTEEENKKALASVSALCQPGSKMISTWIGPNRKSSHDSKEIMAMHRFRTDHPVEFLSQWKWRGEQHQCADLMTRYGRDPTGWNDYIFAVNFYSP